MANFYSLLAAMPYAVVSNLQTLVSLSPFNKVLLVVIISASQMGKVMPTEVN